MKLYAIPLVVAGFFAAVGLSRSYTSKKPSSAPGKEAIKVSAPAVEKTAKPVAKAVPANNSDDAVRDFSMEKSLYRIKGYIKGIEADNLSLKDKAEQLSAALESRSRELSDMSQANSALKEALDKANKAQDELSAELQGSLDTYKQQLSQRDADVSAVSALKVNLENQVAGLNKKLLELISVNSYLEKQIVQNQQERISLTSELGVIKDELSRQAVINETLDKNVAELNSSLSEKESERREALKKIGEAQEKITGLNAEIEELRQSRQENEQKIGELNAKINDLNVSGENMRGKLSELSDLLARREIEISQKTRELSGLKDDLDKANREKDALSLVLNKKEERLIELNSGLSSMKAQISQLKKELKSATERQRKTAQQLNKALASGGATPGEVSRIIAANKSLQEKMTGIYEELELIRTEYKAKERAYQKNGAAAGDAVGMTEKKQE